jgi:putative hydrolase of the HAD superfamily
VTIKVITFDLDNTLWDVEPTLLAAEEEQRAWLVRHRPGAIEQYDHDALWEFKKALWLRHPELKHNISQLRIQLLYELQIAAGYGEEEARSGAIDAFDVFLARRHEVVLYEEALGVLRSLSRQYRLGALTNGNADIFRTDAGEYFDFAFLAEEIGASKPAPDMFHAALELAAVQPEEIVHVGDNPEHDIRPARSLGLHTVWMNSQGIEWPGGTPADQTIDNLLQLPAAIASIEAGVASH